MCRRPIRLNVFVCNLHVRSSQEKRKNAVDARYFGPQRVAGKRQVFENRNNANEPLAGHSCGHNNYQGLTISIKTNTRFGQKVKHYDQTDNEQ